MGPSQGGWVPIGEVDRVRGLVGEVVVTVHADDPARMARLASVFLREPGGGFREVRVEGFKRLGRRAVLKLSGYGTVEAARELLGRELLIPEKASTPAPAGRYYAYQLAGLRALLPGGQPVGTVREVLAQGGQSLLVVDTAAGELLVPFVKAICVDVDLEAGTLTLDPPEGLLELNRPGPGPGRSGE